MNHWECQWKVFSSSFRVKNKIILYRFCVQFCLAIWAAIAFQIEASLYRSKLKPSWVQFSDDTVRVYHEVESRQNGSEIRRPWLKYVHLPILNLDLNHRLMILDIRHYSVIMPFKGSFFIHTQNFLRNSRIRFVQILTSSKARNTLNITIEVVRFSVFSGYFFVNKLFWVDIASEIRVSSLPFWLRIGSSLR